MAGGAAASLARTDERQFASRERERKGHMDMIQIVCGSLAVVLLGVIVLRRKNRNAEE